ncbi:U-box domain-containing protein 51-like isoform X2 [Prosopis cineraria]|uniref:U-box domain-containing protein 51-like isoform X2 n=1 Tax=Prosopis cineraria TaxID=364024 RepID=UPI002410B48A|nr:U-box domain-containing protein 51-like isoform X2 [Prosopis cineraria]
MFAPRDFIPVDKIDIAHKEGVPPSGEEMHQFFLPFRGFCARKGIEAKELVLHDLDVSSALTYYLNNNSIRNIVVGASHRNVLTRKFKDADVPTCLIKSLPESCVIYVISKGKVQNIKPTGQNQNCCSITAKSIKDSHRGNSQADDSQRLPNIPDSEEENRDSVGHGRGQGSGLDGASNSQNHTSTDNSQHEPNGEAGSPVSNESPYSFISDMSGPNSFQSNDKFHENQEAFENLDSCWSLSSKSPKALESEIRKLKLELRKTMEKYTLACKEAIEAKKKAMELEQIREEEGRNLEKARLAEEAALALTEVEREKTRAALESAQMAKLLAEMETEKRKQAETRAMHEEEEKKKAVNALAQNLIRCRRYDISEIEVATNYFDNSLKIGEGGYGPVFRGMLDHTVVAIKVLRPDIASGEKQFFQEVEVLSTIRHPNMVLLLGACPEYGCLVYEYLENGSLEDRLFQKDNTPPIPWKLRFQIAAEIATGLNFLHQTKPEPLVHRDLKPANILLDKNYKTKISDVGLARLVPPSVADKTTQYRMTAAAGTFCYIDPEYQQTGLLGVKSDIYSLGVLLLQILTAKPPMGLSHLVEKAIQTGKFPEVLDPNVTDWPVEEALSFAMLALKCCELRKRDRPSLGSVILPELGRLKDLEEDRDMKEDTDSPDGFDSQNREVMSSNVKVEMEKRQRKPMKSLSSKCSSSRSKIREGSLIAASGKQVEVANRQDTDETGSCWSFGSCSIIHPSSF